MKPVVHTPRDIRSEVARMEQMLRRAERQKRNQPNKKKMNAELYASWLVSKKQS